MLADIRKLILWCMSLFAFGSIVVFRKISFHDGNTLSTSHIRDRATRDRWNLNEHNLNHDQSNIFSYRRLSKSGDFVGSQDQIGLIAPPLHRHYLAVIVPFRNRFDELLSFVPYMDNYLTSKGIKYKIFVVNQIDSYRFNRASLINIGFAYARNQSCDYIAMHDVDLLPRNTLLNYSYPGAHPFHVSGPKLHPKYHYKTFVGGILLISMETFAKLDGMSNSFWGWGREDDELYLRLREAKLEVKRHGDEITTGYATFIHDHDPLKRKRDYPKKGQKSYRKVPRDRATGLSNVQYTMASVNEMKIDSSSATILNVMLKCDSIKTPYCLAQ